MVPYASFRSSSFLFLDFTKPRKILLKYLIPVRSLAREGNGSSRAYKEYGSVASVGLARCEVFVVAGEPADELELQREEEAKLKKQDEQSIVVYPNQDVYRLGVDCHVGDHVSVVTNSGIMLHVHIIQANRSLDETGRTLSLECGSDL